MTVVMAESIKSISIGIYLGKKSSTVNYQQNTFITESSFHPQQNPINNSIVLIQLYMIYLSISYKLPLN